MRILILRGPGAGGVPGTVAPGEMCYIWRMLDLRSLLLCAVLLALLADPAAVLAQEPRVDEPGAAPGRRHEAARMFGPLPRPFGQHTMNASLALGFGVGDGAAFALGGSFGYFVVDGLEPGLDLEATFGEDRATVVSLLPYLRWVPWRSYPFSPFLKAQAGRWFITDYPDISVVGGGGGFVYFLSRWAGLQVEALVLHLIPDQGGCPDDSCTIPSFGLSFGFFFGG